MNRKIIFFAVLLIATYFLYSVLFVPPDKSIIGSKAPLFSLNGPQGESYNLKDSIGKKVILINIWATWCPTCRDEIPVLNRMQKNLDPQEFEIVSLLVDDQDPVGSLDRFRKKLPIDFPVYLDTNFYVADTYGTFKLPESYLIDKNGTVVYKHIGAITVMEEEGMMNRVKKLLR